MDSKLFFWIIAIFAGAISFWLNSKPIIKKEFKYDEAMDIAAILPNAFYALAIWIGPWAGMLVLISAQITRLFAVEKGEKFKKNFAWIFWQWLFMLIAVIVLLVIAILFFNWTPVFYIPWDEFRIGIHPPR